MKNNGHLLVVVGLRVVSIMSTNSGFYSTNQLPTVYRSSQRHEIKDADGFPGVLKGLSHVIMPGLVCLDGVVYELEE